MDLSVIVPLYNNERYIGAALDSALGQEIADMEILVINDGSTDSGPDIVAKYASEYQQVVLINQANRGVSEARNAGLDRAKGKYVAFLDSDDVFRSGALADMVLVAEKRCADLVIGESRSVRTFKTDVLPQSRQLSHMQVIDKEDPNLVYNFSNCNKLFRKSIIDEFHLRYRHLRHAEDGLFLYEYLEHCGLITGCPEYVYEYRKRLSFETKSALKSLDASMFNDAMAACEAILGITDSWSEDYRREMFVRILRITIMGEYYRRLWTLDDDVLEAILSKADDYRRLISEEQWQAICALNEDLECEKGLKRKQDFIGAPLVTILVEHSMPEDEYLKFLSSLYYQTCPSFEVRVDAAYREETPQEFGELGNFHFFEHGLSLGDVVAQSRGRYIHIVREGCVYNEDSLKLMLRRIQTDEVGFISVKPMAYHEERGFAFRPLDELFTKQAIKKCAKNAKWKSECAQRDLLLTSKLFERSALIRVLEGMNAGQTTNIVGESYGQLEYQRYGNVLIGITTGLDEAIRLEGERERGKGASRAATAPTERDKRLNQENMLKHFSYVLCSHLMPVNKKKVLFLSDIRTRIGGNYAPLKPLLKERGYTVRTLFQAEKNKPMGRKRALKLGCELATSAYIVLEDFHKDTAGITVRKNQELVQLWHACGAFKRFAWSRAGGNENINIHPGYKKYTKAIVSAEAIRKDYAEAFHIGLERVAATGIPRTDVFFEAGRAERLREEYCSKYPVLKGKKIVLIAPTYRGTTLSRATYAFDKLSLEALHEALGDEYVFVLKWHPALQTALGHRKKGKRKPYDLKKMAGYVLDLSKRRDINDLLMIADVLVTDFSSVIFEYALMDKPIVYYWYDLNEWIIGRGMYYDFDEYVYGRVAYREEELAGAIAADDLCEDKRAVFMEKYMSACDGRSAEKTVDWVFGQL